MNNLLSQLQNSNLKERGFSPVPRSQTGEVGYPRKSNSNGGPVFALESYATARWKVRPPLVLYWLNVVLQLPLPLILFLFMALLCLKQKSLETSCGLYRLLPFGDAGLAFVTSHLWFENPVRLPVFLDVPFIIPVSAVQSGEICCSEGGRLRN